MNRLISLAVLACALVCAPAPADDPPKKPAEREKLEAKWTELTQKGLKDDRDGKFTAAERAWTEALELARRLYPKADFPDGHVNLADSLNNLGDLYRTLRYDAEAEPLLKEALAMRRRLYKGDNRLVANSLNNLGNLFWAQGKFADAEPLLLDAVAMMRRLYKDDHRDLAVNLNMLAVVYRSQGRFGEAEPLFKEALEMTRRLFKGDHLYVAVGMNNLGNLYWTRGKFAEAEPLFREALEMKRRLLKGDHPEIAAGLNNLATLFEARGRYAEAEPLFKESLEMLRRVHKGDHPEVVVALSNLAVLHCSQGKFAEAEPLARGALDMARRLFKGDHPSLAGCLNNLGLVYLSQQKYAEAEPFYKEALEVKRRLYKRDHPDLALGLNNLSNVYQGQGKYAEAEPLLKEALAINTRLYGRESPDVIRGTHNLAELYQSRDQFPEAERLYKEVLALKRKLFGADHPDLPVTLINLAVVYWLQGKHADAEPLLTEAQGVSRRLVARHAREKPEGDALTLLASLPRTRSIYLSNERARGADPAAVYAQVWAEKGFVARAYESRQLRARAAADPKAAELLAELTETRRRRAELLLAPAPKDAATRDRRAADLAAYEERVAALTKKLDPLLPVLERGERLAGARPADLQKALPPGAAVVDFLSFVRISRAKNKNGTIATEYAVHYLAFVVTRDAVAWVELDDAANIHPAVAAWREAITGGKEIPAAVPAKVRELVWEPVRKLLPAGTTTVYVCPDAALCRVPFAALPGDKPGTILLEDFALAAVPHAPFLLDKLAPRDARAKPAGAALVVGGVRYDAEPVGAEPSAGPRGVLIRPGTRAGWSFLPGTVGEADGVAATAGRKKIATTRVAGERATPAAVLAELPKARYAHLATHGFFADASFRSAFRLDPKDFETRGGERVGRVVNSPLVMTGLVLAGANDPKAPGRGIVTGEQLIDLDLSGLELAVLSACETGLGDVADGEGAFGLQRAFHYAGATDVVCSLWKVPDQPTAALMALFYANLWDHNLPPVEALRRAQLELYKNPQKIPELAKEFRGKLEEVGGGGAEVKAPKDGRAHPLLWAAFTLSGPGR